VLENGSEGDRNEEGGGRQKTPGTTRQRTRA
jgi:hypothetical protein